jgi:hypothetical protein
LIARLILFPLTGRLVAKRVGLLLAKVRRQVKTNRSEKLPRPAQPYHGSKEYDERVNIQLELPQFSGLLFRQKKTTHSIMQVRSVFSLLLVFSYRPKYFRFGLCLVSLFPPTLITVFGYLPLKNEAENISQHIRLVVPETKVRFESILWFFFSGKH